MPTQGPTICGTGADSNATGTVTWSNPGNITADDASYATATLGASAVSHYLKATNFGFSIPGTATISGILVEWEYFTSNPTIDTTERIVKGGTVSGNNYGTGLSWSNFESWVPYGGSADLWGLTWTPADINASTFGAAMSVTGDSGLGGNPSVNACRITVTYTVPSDPTARILQATRETHPAEWLE